MVKILIIRFSSIGDIIQCMSIIGTLKAKFPNSEIHWIARADMAPLLSIDNRINHIWQFNRKDGMAGLFKVSHQLKKEKYTHIYDAHSNIRSNILKFILCPFGICHILQKKVLVTRHKNRLKRLLLFYFGINLFDKPFRAFESFTKPLNHFKTSSLSTVGLTINSNHHYSFPIDIKAKVDGLLNSISDKNWICLVPSAAWELKRWPIAYWKELINLSPNKFFVILGGKQDAFCEEIKEAAPHRVLNLAGKTSLLESFYVVQKASYVISGDTGFLHAADLFEKPGQAIIGPTAFGFPTGEKMKIMGVDLPCRPCTKDGNVKCKNREYKKCLMDISPTQVAEQLVNWDKHTMLFG